MKLLLERNPRVYIHTRAGIRGMHLLNKGDINKEDMILKGLPDNKESTCSTQEHC